MTSKLTRDIIQSEIADFFAGVVQIHTELGGPNTVEEAQNQLTERVLACVPAVDSEPVVYASEETLAYAAHGELLLRVLSQPAGDAIIPLYRHAQQAPLVQCPFPCGWDNLNKLSIQDAALVARGLAEGEPTTEAHRQAAISNNDRLLKVITACRAAMLQAGNSPVNDVTNGKPLTIILPDITSKAFWSGTGKTEIFHPETYCRWVKEAIERYCAIARIDVEVK